MITSKANLYKNKWFLRSFNTRSDVGEDPVVHEALPQVLNDSRLRHLSQQRHVVRAGPLVVRALPRVDLQQHMKIVIKADRKKHEANLELMIGI
jgi:hypothetical protein